MEFPKGSEWRRWDLHLHTPKSIVQNFGGDTAAIWNKYVTALAALPANIQALAVTDYLFIDGYEELLKRRDKFPNIKLLMPNIEFRLNTFSGTQNNSKRHNYHILFDPAVEPQDIREQLLNALSTGYKISDKQEWHNTPTPRSLSELGKQLKAEAPAGNTIHNKSDLEAGFDNITYSQEHIEKLLQKTPFKGRFVTAVGYSEWNQAKWDQSAAQKRTLINSTNFALTNNDDPAVIAANSQNLRENNLNDIVLHSSDAHGFDRVGKTLLWLKADPTFAGLKQVLNEPQERVHIGSSPPNLKPDHRVINQISIPSSQGWFQDGFIQELNRDLVTVIGGRGSGKSALAEAIAFGAGSKDDGEDAFLKKATKHQNSISRTRIELTWADGTPTGYDVGQQFSDAGRVKFLPQGAVEELCSHRNSETLQLQIENVIFQSLDSTQRLGASDFSELKSRVLSDFRYRREQVSRRLLYINKRLAELLALLQSEPDKRNRIVDLRSERTNIEASLPILPAEDLRGQEELLRLNEQRKQFEEKIRELSDSLGKVRDIETIVGAFLASIDEYEREVSVPVSELLGVDPEVFKANIDHVAITLQLSSFKGIVQSKLDALRAGTAETVATILGVEANSLSAPNLTSLAKAIADKKSATQAFETGKIRYQQLKAESANIEQKIEALERELLRIASEYSPEVIKLQHERSESYASYFQVLREEMKKLSKLYEPLQTTLAQGSDTDRKLLFEAKINFRVDPFFEEGVSLIDRTRRGSFREHGTLRTSLETFGETLRRANFNADGLKSGLDSLLEMFLRHEGEEMDINQQLRDNRTIEDFYNWLFDPSYFEVISSIKFEGADLYVLSPGQKGIILLMLYLEIDKADTRPLIIDQPEENLDNLSVYTDLMHFFRKRKKYRQIIMVTHNPNLVVNTDADQVIVANYDGLRLPRLSYCSGSLEDQAKHIPNVPVDQLDDGIVEQVCNVLEGGDKAFSSRRRTYQKSPKTRL